MSQKRVAGVVLAAGRSRRMGEAKQLIEINGQSLLRRTVETVLETIPDTRVVFGFRAQELQDSISELPISALTAPQWESGLSESVKIAVASVLAWNQRCSLEESSEGFWPHEAILFVPCDLPLLTSAHLSALVEAYQGGEAPLVASQWDDVLGVPALFDQRLWPELEALSGDEGARKIIRRHEHEALSVAFPGGKYDLDTPQQVAEFRNGRLK